MVERNRPDRRGLTPISRALRTVALVGLAALALAGDAAACSCAAAPPRQRLGSADAAFIGRLVEARPAPGPSADLLYSFLVDQVVKGKLPRRLDVRSPAEGSACGFELKVDEAVGILLHRDGEAWVSGFCGQIGTGELLLAAETDDEPLVNWGGVVFGVLVIGLAAVLVVRRLRGRTS